MTIHPTYANDGAVYIVGGKNKTLHMLRIKYKRETTEELV